MNIIKQMRTIFLLFILLVSIGFITPVSAGIIDDLKSKISGRSSEVKKLEKEITRYQVELEDIGKEKASLQKEVKTLDITRKKLSTDIKVTKNKVFVSSLNLEKLSIEISDKEEKISNNIVVIKATIRKINEIEGNSLAELVLSSVDMSELWNDINTFQQFQISMEESVHELQALKVNLEENKSEVENERNNYLSLKSKLSDQKKIVDNNRYKRNKILKSTKNKESNYQKQLDKKLRLKKEFERELLDLESQLRVAIDPNSIPRAGSGIFAPPLAGISYKSCYSGEKIARNCITQFFGNTAFAKSGAYRGKGHNGVDFRATTGTEIKAVLSGTIVETGNTDLIRNCESYGKWVLIKHNNGLSTLYAHMSLIKAVAGQKVNTGDAIGYSGNSGFSTGPHLHLTTYATQGVKVVGLGDWYRKNGRNATTPCSKGNARIPTAPFNAYLNSLDYL